MTDNSWLKKSSYEDPFRTLPSPPQFPPEDSNKNTHLGPPRNGVTSDRNDSVVYELTVN